MIDSCNHDPYGTLCKACAARNEIELLMSEKGAEIVRLRAESAAWNKRAVVAEAELAKLRALCAVDTPEENVEAVTRMTLAMREADEIHERVGGGTRHHVRECLLPVLERHGIKLVLINAAGRGEGER